eukprot:8355301-Pyramimonas_sp.AAC.1
MHILLTESKSNSQRGLLSWPGRPTWQDISAALWRAILPPIYGPFATSTNRRNSPDSSSRG